MLPYNDDSVDLLIDEWHQLKQCHVSTFKSVFQCQRTIDQLSKEATALVALRFDGASNAELSVACNQFANNLAEYSKKITFEILKNGPILKSVPKSST